MVGASPVKTQSGCCSTAHVHAGAQGSNGSVSEGTIYTCPMHPQIRQAGPGFCPICGMALEPEVASAGAAPNPELAAMTRRFWVGLLLTIPVLTLEMGGHLTSLHMLLGQTWSNWLQFLFATPVVLWAGWPFFVRGWQSLVSRNLNMFTLIAIGIGVAWLYSMVAILLPGVFPPAFRGAGGAVDVYFEAAAVITVLVLLGQVLELRAREQMSGAIRALLDLAPKTARRLNADGSEEEMSLDAIAGADPAAGRPSVRLVRAGGDHHRARGFRGLEHLRARAAFRLRTGRWRYGFDHRLSLRTRFGDADVDHGRCGARRRGRGADQERRGAGADGKDRHARRRQDRNAHGRQAEGG